MKYKETVIEAVLDLELEMFQAVKTVEPAPCQQDPQRFRVMRRAPFTAWPLGALESYLQDLREAAQTGKNLMTLKYARMGNLIPPINASPLISRIAEIQWQWQREMADRYPKIMSRGRPLDEDGLEAGAVSFKAYLMGELETYSSRTLEALFDDMAKRLENNENMTRIIYERMMADLGYDSLEEAEASVSSR